jgi:hypothetical protein
MKRTNETLPGPGRNEVKIWFQGATGSGKTLLAPRSGQIFNASSEHGLSNANKSTIRIGRTNSNLVETQSVEDHPQKPRHHDHPADRQRITNYQRENIIHGLPP